jgi:hypothetical protein
MPILGIMASQISGHLWSPEGAYDALATVTLSATTASVTFAGIPTGYKHLQIRMLSRTTRAITNDTLEVTFNGDTTASNYARHVLYGDGASAAAVGTTSNSDIGTTAGASCTASVFGANVIDILDYANTNKTRTVRYLAGFDNNGSGQVRLGSTLYLGTSALNTIKIDAATGGGSFVQYTQLALYGVK